MSSDRRAVVTSRNTTYYGIYNINSRGVVFTKTFQSSVASAFLVTSAVTAWQGNFKISSRNTCHDEIVGKWLNCGFFRLESSNSLRILRSTKPKSLYFIVLASLLTLHLLVQAKPTLPHQSSRRKNSILLHSLVIESIWRKIDNSSYSRTFFKYRLNW